MSDIKDRRGCIKVSKQLLDQFDASLYKEFFSNFYPINVETIEFDNKMYYGYSEHFDISKEGDSILYDAVFTTTPDGFGGVRYEVSFNKY